MALDTDPILTATNSVSPSASETSYRISTNLVPGCWAARTLLTTGTDANAPIPKNNESTPIQPILLASYFMILFPVSASRGQAATTSSRSYDFFYSYSPAKGTSPLILVCLHFPDPPVDILKTIRLNHVEFISVFCRSIKQRAGKRICGGFPHRERL